MNENNFYNLAIPQISLGYNFGRNQIPLGI